MPAYYNEIEPYAAQWLRNLIGAGLIAPGEVDERDIRDVRPDDLMGFAQCHFFAGIGVWSYALRAAGWPDDRPVWTGSCPCQPFSSAGRGKGFDDERHLWPTFFGLIRKCRPDLVLGEQVASKDGLGWLDLVHADLEGEDYAVGAVDLCAAGLGAPHIRQRLWWVAHAGPQRRVGVDALLREETPGRDTRYFLETAGGCKTGRVSVADGDGHYQGRGCLAEAGGDGALGDGSADRPGPTNGHWRDADWLYCRDARWRPIEPGLEPLAHGATARVGRLRAYGNAIVAPVAEAFIQSVMECLP